MRRRFQLQSALRRHSTALGYVAARRYSAGHAGHRTWPAGREGRHHWSAVSIGQQHRAFTTDGCVTHSRARRVTTKRPVRRRPLGGRACAAGPPPCQHASFLEWKRCESVVCRMRSSGVGCLRLSVLAFLWCRARVSLAGAFAEAVLSPALERLVAAPCTGYGAVFRPELLSSPELALALRRARAAACHSGAAACSSVAGDGDASWKERAAALQVLRASAPGRG